MASHQMAVSINNKFGRSLNNSLRILNLSFPSKDNQLIEGNETADTTSGPHKVFMSDKPEGRAWMEYVAANSR
jgi:hypothetical protein